MSRHVRYPSLMACGCGKKALNATQDAPLLLGRPNGAPGVRVRAAVGVGGIPRGGEAWVTGSHVGPLTERGYLVTLVPA